ncbi:biotin/lipoyl-containing protein, partial [Ideonella sp. A 288]|uniref:biotin/lipoyl-containing protein n=1 Tax=Ideonella sp. A 288 TaxID=1962181 RepID=UPI00287393AB
MATDRVIKVPDVGEGVAEVELVAWHVQPGDSVAEDQILADVMTDKASVEIPSPVAGRVLALGGVVGQTLAVGAELIRLEVAAAGTTAAPASTPAPAAAPAPALAAASPTPTPTPAPPAATATAPPVAASPTPPAPRGAAPQ